MISENTRKCAYKHSTAGGKQQCAPGIQRKFRIQHAALDRELLQEQLEAVTPLNIVDEKDAFALDELQLENNVDE